MWSIYLLQHTSGRTYIGATTDLPRRIRQHNSEIRGGARSTTRMGDGWEVVAYLSGFRNRRDAYRWEKLTKQRRGLRARVEAFKHVSSGEIWHSRDGKRQYSPPEYLVFAAFGPASDILNGGNNARIIAELVESPPSYPLL